MGSGHWIGCRGPGWRVGFGMMGNMVRMGEGLEQGGSVAGAGPFQSPVWRPFTPNRHSRFGRNPADRCVRNVLDSGTPQAHLRLSPEYPCWMSRVWLVWVSGRGSVIGLPGCAPAGDSGALAATGWAKRVRVSEPMSRNSPFAATNEYRNSMGRPDGCGMISENAPRFQRGGADDEHSRQF